MKKSKPIPNRASLLGSYDDVVASISWADLGRQPLRRIARSFAPMGASADALSISDSSGRDLKQLRN